MDALKQENFDLVERLLNDDEFIHGLEAIMLTNLMNNKELMSKLFENCLNNFLYEDKKGEN